MLPWISGSPKHFLRSDEIVPSTPMMMSTNCYVHMLQSFIASLVKFEHFLTYFYFSLMVSRNNDYLIIFSHWQYLDLNFPSVLDYWSCLLSTSTNIFNYLKQFLIYAYTICQRGQILVGWSLFSLIHIYFGATSWQTFTYYMISRFMYISTWSIYSVSVILVHFGLDIFL